MPNRLLNRASLSPRLPAFLCLPQVSAEVYAQLERALNGRPRARDSQKASLEELLEGGDMTADVEELLDDKEVRAGQGGEGRGEGGEEVQDVKEVRAGGREGEEVHGGGRCMWRLSRRWCVGRRRGEGDRAGSTPPPTHTSISSSAPPVLPPLPPPLTHDPVLPPLPPPLTHEYMTLSSPLWPHHSHMTLSSPLCPHHSHIGT